MAGRLDRCCRESPLTLGHCYLFLLVALIITVMHAVSEFYLPDRLSRASQLYGAVGTTIVTLGWFFILGRGIVLAMELNAAIYRANICKNIVQVVVLASGFPDLRLAGLLGCAGSLGSRGAPGADRKPHPRQPPSPAGLQRESPASQGPGSQPAVRDATVRRAIAFDCGTTSMITAGAGGRGAMRARLPDSAGFGRAHDGVKVSYELFGHGDPTIVLMPPWSIVHSRTWKMQVPFLTRHSPVSLSTPAATAARTGRARRTATFPPSTRPTPWRSWTPPAPIALRSSHSRVERPTPCISARSARSASSGRSSSARRHPWRPSRQRDCPMHSGSSRRSTATQAGRKITPGTGSGTTGDF